MIDKFKPIVVLWPLFELKCTEFLWTYRIVDRGGAINLFLFEKIFYFYDGFGDFIIRSF